MSEKREAIQDTWQSRPLAIPPPPCPLTVCTSSLPGRYNKSGHSVVRVDEASVLLAWDDKPLLAMSAWQPRD